MNSLLSDDLINAPNEDIPAAIPTRRYLLRASALLCLKRAARTGVSMGQECTNYKSVAFVQSQTAWRMFK